MVTVTAQDRFRSVQMEHTDQRSSRPSTSQSRRLVVAVEQAARQAARQPGRQMRNPEQQPRTATQNSNPEQQPRTATQNGNREQEPRTGTQADRLAT